MDALRSEIEAALSHALTDCDLSSSLHAAMRYSLLSGGKRLRALLCCSTCSALTGQHEAALDAACALEMIHAYSLIHDDLPAMDDDQLRRGQPTCHIEFDEAEAILAGDALQAEAFRLLAQQPLDAATVVATITTLAQAAGANGMVGGQSLDMAAEGTTQADLETLHGAKTGALLTASMQLGAQIAGADSQVIERLVEGGRKLGLAFQVVDDVLDVTGSSAELGKDAGSDAAQGKLTFVDLLGARDAQTYAEDLYARAELDLKQAFALQAARSGANHQPQIDLLLEVARALVQRSF